MDRPTAYVDTPEGRLEAQLTAANDRIAELEAALAAKIHDIGYLIAIVETAIEDDFDLDEDESFFIQVSEEIASLAAAKAISEEPSK